jgi:hypothetical protein
MASWQYHSANQEEKFMPPPKRKRTTSTEFSHSRQSKPKSIDDLADQIDTFQTKTEESLDKMRLTLNEIKDLLIKPERNDE